MKKYNEFMISAWTPPPNGYLTVGGKTTWLGQDFRTEERYREYRECGFDTIVFAGETKYQGELYEISDLKKMLDLAAKTDLKAVVYDERIIRLTVAPKTSIKDEMFDGDEGKFFAYVRDCLDTYRSHPAFYGVAIIDEPFIAKVGVMREICEAVHAVDPEIFLHTCFLPCIQDLGLAPDAFGKGFATVWDAYDNYIDGMTDNTLGYYCYDAYPFGMWEGKNCMSEKYIRNMQQAALGAIRNQVPFHMAIQSFSAGANDENRRVDESDLNWQSNMALGFGAKSIYYYTYWIFTTLAHEKGQTSAIMAHDGTRMIYDDVQRNNAMMRRVFETIKDYEYVASQVLDAPEHGNPTTKELVTTDLGFVKSHTADAPLLLNKMTGEKGNAYMLLNLRDPFEKAINRVCVKLTNPKPEYEILVRGRKMTVKTDGDGLCLTLEPGEAVFILD